MLPSPLFTTKAMSLAYRLHRLLMYQWYLLYVCALGLCVCINEKGTKQEIKIRTLDQGRLESVKHQYFVNFDDLQ